MRRFIQNLSLKQKIHSIAMICVLLLTTSALIGIQLTSSAYNKTLYKTTASSLSASASEISNYLENINSMADMFLADSTIQWNLGTLKDSSQVQGISASYQAVYSSLTEYYFTFRKNHINYMILSQGPFTIRTHISLSTLPEDIWQDLLQRASDAKGATIWITDYSEDYGLFMVKSLRRTEYLKLDDIGTLIVNVDLDGLISDTSAPDFLREESAYVLYDDHLIYASPLLPAGNTRIFPQSFSDSYGPIRIGGKNFFYVKSRIPNFNWIYLCVIPYDNITASVQASFQLCIIILLLAIVVASLLSSSLIHSITRHFDTLILKMKCFGDGSSEPPSIDYDYSQRTDELGIIHQQFDLMVEEVNQLIRTNYLNEILIKEAQFKALENQMNPHFLYNTLESINWRAKIVGAKDISSMAESLGTLLRITLDQKSKEVPLCREIELVQCYMTIQKYRYEDRLNYELQIPDKLMNCHVLKLTLQPLVENAIRYGLEENTESCLIQILAEVDEEQKLLYLYIKNNGSCFEDDLLEKLKSHEIMPHGFGIGILNIQNRMQLTYGDEYGLKLYNEDDLAVARLTYPLTISEKE